MSYYTTHKQEINALLQLLDDPDEAIYKMVTNKIYEYGKDIVPHLEAFWQESQSLEVMERIEEIIHKLQVNGIEDELIKYISKDYHSAFEGGLLVGSFIYPDLPTQPFLAELERMRRSVWLEINSYLTPLEKIRVVNNILYRHYKFEGTDKQHNHPEDFTLQKCMESKKGNIYPMAILYEALCASIDLPVLITSIPKHNLLAVYDNDFYYTKSYDQLKVDTIKFFINPVTGSVHNHEDIKEYFRKIQVPPIPAYFKPKGALNLMRELFIDLASCYEKAPQAYKSTELKDLAQILESYGNG
jgi:hypothetical protein